MVLNGHLFIKTTYSSADTRRDTLLVDILFSKKEKKQQQQPVQPILTVEWRTNERKNGKNGKGRKCCNIFRFFRRRGLSPALCYYAIRLLFFFLFWSNTRDSKSFVWFRNRGKKKHIRVDIINSWDISPVSTTDSTDKLAFVNYSTNTPSKRRLHVNRIE